MKNIQNVFQPARGMKTLELISETWFLSPLFLMFSFCQHSGEKNSSFQNMVLNWATTQEVVPNPRMRYEFLLQFSRDPPCLGCRFWLLPGTPLVLQGTGDGVQRNSSEPPRDYVGKLGDKGAMWEMESSPCSWFVLTERLLSSGFWHVCIPCGWSKKWLEHLLLPSPYLLGTQHPHPVSLCELVIHPGLSKFVFSFVTSQN